MQLLAAFILASACRTASTPRATTTDKTSPTSQRHTHENLNGVLWMQTSAEYRALALQAYRLATTQLDAAVRDPRWTAAVEQSRDPYRSSSSRHYFDLDETVLDNSAFRARRISNGVLFSEDAAGDRWCEERSARPIPGAVEFLTHAQALGVKPIYITNRDHRVERRPHAMCSRRDRRPA